MLESEERDGNDTLDALLEAYPDFSTISFYDKMTRITIETISGKLTVTITKDLATIISYLPLSPSLSHILTVLITELKHRLKCQ